MVATRSMRMENSEVIIYQYFNPLVMESAAVRKKPSMQIERAVGIFASIGWCYNNFRQGIIAKRLAKYPIGPGYMTRSEQLVESTEILNDRLTKLGLLAKTPSRKLHMIVTV